MKVVARVQITVEVDVHEAWSDKATLAEVQKSAVKGASDALRSGMVLHGLTIGNDRKVPARVVGDPRVITALVMPEESNR